jgi:hypothetical protein
VTNVNSSTSTFAVPDHEVSLILEIHFHEQEKASVFLESNVSAPSGNFGEVYLFTLFALRQLATLGETESVALAGSLLDIGPIIKELASGHELSGVKVVPYPGYQGRKILLARFTLRNENQSFYFNTKGFGLLSRGIGYYSPTGVLVLLRYLAMRHSSEEAYLAKLAQAAQLCGALYSQRQLTVTNQSQVALLIVGSLLGEEKQ